MEGSRPRGSTNSAEEDPPPQGRATSDIILTFPQAVTAAPAATSPIKKRVAVPSPPPPPTTTLSACCSPHSNSAPQSIIAAPPTASSGPSNKPSHPSPPTAMRSAHHSSDPVQTPPVIAAVLPTNTWICKRIAPSSTITPHGQSGSVPPVIVEKKRKRVMAETHDDQGGRGQCQRKAPATKEVIPLTDAKRLDPHITRYVFIFFFPLQRPVFMWLPGWARGGAADIWSPRTHKLLVFVVLLLSRGHAHVLLDILMFLCSR